MITQRHGAEDSHLGLLILGVVVVIGIVVCVVGLATTDSSNELARAAYAIGIIAGLVTAGSLVLNVLMGGRAALADGRDPIDDLVESAEQFVANAHTLPPDVRERKVRYFATLREELASVQETSEVPLAWSIALARLAAAVRAMREYERRERERAAPLSSNEPASVATEEEDEAT